MMELMLAAQQAAQSSTVEQSSKDTKVALGNGFKKGFFSQNKKENKTIKHIQNVKKTNASIETIIPKTQSSLVFDEVQVAMEEDKSPMLKQLQQGGTCRHRLSYMTI